MTPVAELLPDLERRRLRALVSAAMAAAGPPYAKEYWLVTPAGSGADQGRLLGVIRDLGAS